MDAVKRTKYRWVIIVLMFAISIVDYIDRSAIAYAVGTISKQFSLTPSHMGWILGIFGLGYVITTLYGGILADRGGPRRIMIVAVICWCLSLIGCGLAVGFVTLMIARFMLGISEGPNFPCMTRSVANWLPQKEHAQAFSWSLVAVPISLAIGGPIVSHLIVSIGWRGMFIALGVVGLIWVPFWWIYYRNRPAQTPRVNAQELQYIHSGGPVDVPQHRGPIPWKKLLLDKTLLANYWAFFVFGVYLFFFMTWLPSFLDREYHLDLLTIGWFTFIPWLVAAIFMVAVGYWVDAMRKRNYRNRISRSYVMIVSQFLSAACLLPLLVSQSLLAAMVCISAAVGFLMSANQVYYAVNVDVIKRWSGTALGIMDAGFAVSGFVAPLITGFIVHITGHFYMAFALMILLSLSSIIFLLCCHQPDRKIDA